MDYFLSKFLPLFVYPLGLSILLGLVAAVAAAKRRRGWVVANAVLGVSLLWFAAAPNTADWIIGKLARGYPPMAPAEYEQVDAIVVLGGGVSREGSSGYGANLGAEADRILVAKRLYDAGRAPLIIVSGGAAEGQVAESSRMRLLLREWGVPEAAIVEETRSRNTRQNAVNTEQLMEARGLCSALLVTSAHHMRRALAVFRSTGVDAEPASANYDMPAAQEYPILGWMPHAGALYETTGGLKEYIGFMVYRWRGWID